ncbi:MAG: hypothetical protein IJT78_03020 [Oscillospiraceae bacterium]|nr:hypothetical protein [Oscillospiraceae bacterium]
MRWRERIGNTLARWFYGRNGVDQLNIALIYLMAAVHLAGWLVRSQAAVLALDAIGTVLLAVTVFRLFSRNLTRRRAENAVFVRYIWRPARNRLQQLRDRSHRYVTCPDCGAVCRVPRIKGTIEITCPKCGAKRRVKG